MATYDPKAVRLGFALTGSFCTFASALEALERLTRSGFPVTGILSYHAGSLDTKFGPACEWRRRLSELTGAPVLDSLTAVEPIGPQGLFDLLIVAPCTGNTLAKLALGVTDTPVTMAVKSQLRVERPVLLAPATNDGLAASAKNIGALLNTKNIYFVPFAQDAPATKPRSLMADMERLPEAVDAALAGKQLQAILAR